MELTGLQIFKYLPGAKKEACANCKKCGFPTCMAFALKLAKKQAELEKCPHIPEELKTIFLESSKIQQHEIKLSETLTTGGETVLYRHDKTFVNKTVIAVELNEEDENFDQKLKELAKYQTERIGETFKIDAIYLNGNENDSKHLNCKKKIEDIGLSVISQNNTNYDIVKAQSFESLIQNSQEALKNNKKNLLLELDFSNKTPAQITEELTYIRRASIQHRFEPLTYPVMVKIPENYSSLEVSAIASLLICRYANIIVLNEKHGFNKALLSTLFTLRQSIYTNPQKPLQVEAKVYEFNEPDKNAPILLTTNFALTYFAVAGELEQLPFGTYLVVTPSDGMSVLTAWSADKFTADIVAKTIKNYDLLNKVNTRTIIIPGLLSHMQEELQEVLPEWEVVVGTIEACQIPEFLKNKKANK